ncbi:MAG: SurA N-terminal domain-containing protein [Proteobacteria bacterium]|nr:SurA N-terminal domain-containing protein [Pseudomonadota bacterium]
MKVLLSLFALCLLSTPANAEIADAIVATAGERIITFSEVMTEAKIVKVMRSKTGSLSLPLRVSYSDEILEQVINRELVYLEAKKIQADLEDTHIIDEMLAFKDKFQSQAAFYRFLKEEGLEVDDMAERLLKEKVSAAYVSRRLSLMATVSKKEIEDFYESSSEYEDLDLKDVEREIRQKLLSEKIEKSLDEWLLRLRKRDKVRYFKGPQY